MSPALSKKPVTRLTCYLTSRLVVHTGNITHLAKPARFDSAKQLLDKLKAPLMTFPANTNSSARRPRISPRFGNEQLGFAENDRAAQKASMPIFVFGHFSFYALYPQWSWATEEGARVPATLARFDAVTVLNGRIQQIITHTDRSIRFATAAATAYPRAAPGTA